MRVAAANVETFIILVWGFFLIPFFPRFHCGVRNGGTRRAELRGAEAPRSIFSGQRRVSRTGRRERD